MMDEQLFTQPLKDMINEERRLQKEHESMGELFSNAIAGLSNSPSASMKHKRFLRIARELAFELNELSKKKIQALEKAVKAHEQNK